MPAPPTSTVERFLDVPIATLRIGETLPFPVYAEIHGTPVIYRKEGEPFLEFHQQQVRGMGLKHLLAPMEALEDYLRYLYGAFQEILEDDALDPEQKLEACYESGVQVTKRALLDPGSEGAFQAIKQFVRVSLVLLEQFEFTYTGLQSVMDHAPKLSGHSVNVALYGLLLGRIAGYHPLEELGLALLLHDVGMVTMPTDILEKPELDPADWEQIKTHPEVGIKRTRCASRLPAVARDVIQNHHERMDGKGYPRGLIGTQLTVPSRIAGIVNTFDSRTTERHYRAASPTLEVVQKMWKDRAGFDPDLLQGFVRALTT